MTGIPAEIGQLSKLRIANFANNKLSGLPLEIGNLTQLETLDLRGNPNLSQHDLDLIRAKIPKTTILTD
jgi:Leucine-rich repeat (LRR) protein